LRSFLGALGAGFALEALRLPSPELLAISAVSGTDPGSRVVLAAYVAAFTAR
jgi:hypothetical protein